MQHFLQEHEVQNILIGIKNRSLVISKVRSPEAHGEDDAEEKGEEAEWDDLSHRIRMEDCSSQ